MAERVSGKSDKMRASSANATLKVNKLNKITDTEQLCGNSAITATEIPFSYVRKAQGSYSIFSLGYTSHWRVDLGVLNQDTCCETVMALTKENSGGDEKMNVVMH